MATTKDFLLVSLVITLCLASTKTSSAASARRLMQNPRVPPLAATVPPLPQKPSFPNTMPPLPPFNLPNIIPIPTTLPPTPSFLTLPPLPTAAPNFPAISSPPPSK
ncbi:unnamed protein product [Cuscuta campestris]|uniref:Uncharacterized protein n=1 Tax=Cuscuta campestris TaxID=132261 RepID=A0A484N165_9ASTE|nr:unnamed protein product [Cuscuta campestris]